MDNRVGSSFQGGLKAIAETTRLKIIRLLVRHGELCVSDIVKMLALSQVKVSQHLRVMKFQDIVQIRREGKSVFYTLYTDRINKLLKNLQEVFIYRDEK